MLAATAGTGSAAFAGYTASDPVLDADNDGSCDTRPTTYPADGEPVPDLARCSLLTDDSGAVVGEAWSWADSDSVQWYSYVAATEGDPPVSGSVVMCGSTDTGHQGNAYACSPDSTYLLFTVAGVFVEWPTGLAADLYYCELTTFGEGDTAVFGRACGTVGPAAPEPPGDGGGEADVIPSLPPTPSDQPAEPDPSPSATPSVTLPTDDSDTGPITSDEPEPPSPTSTAPQDAPSESVDHSPTPPAVPSASSVPAGGPAASESTSTRSTGADAAEAKAITSASVARVGGSPVPMGLLLALAGALAVGGLLMLAGPGFVAARRQRR